MLHHSFFTSATLFVSLIYCIYPICCVSCYLSKAVQNYLLHHLVKYTVAANLPLITPLTIIPNGSCAFLGPVQVQIQAKMRTWIAPEKVNRNALVPRLETTVNPALKRCTLFSFCICTKQEERTNLQQGLTERKTLINKGFSLFLFYEKKNQNILMCWRVHSSCLVKCFSKKVRVTVSNGAPEKNWQRFKLFPNLSKIKKQDFGWTQIHAAL